MMAEQTVFSQKTVAGLIVVGFLAFAGAIHFLFVGSDSEHVRRAGNNAYSEAAVGHRALVQVLRKLGIPVLVSRNRSIERAGDSGLLVIAEPPVALAATGQKSDILKDLSDAPRVLYVLPKWRGTADPEKPHWLRKAELLPAKYVRSVLWRVETSTEIARPSELTEWSSGRFTAPSISHRPQLITGGQLVPIISTAEGMLLARSVHRDVKRWVLSDPDILANHGIGDGDNAALIANVVDRLRDGGPVIIDETVHGLRRDPSLWRSLFDLPFVIVTIAAAFAAAVLVWAVTGRFGSPLPSARAFAAGKETLIENTAGLLLYGGHVGESLRRYRQVGIRAVARNSRAPGGLKGADLAEWLDRASVARGMKVPLHRLHREIDALSGAKSIGAHRVVAAARKLHSWKQEMIHGPGNHPVDKQ